MSPKKSSRKTARKAATSKRAAKRGPAAKKTARKAAARKSATKRAAGTRSSGKSSTTARKKSTAKPAKRAPAKAASKKSSARRPSAVTKKAAPARKRTANAAEVARQHFREILEAKQQRAKQGPSYPAPNAFTGRAHDGVGAVRQPMSPPVQDSSPGVEATYGEGEFASGRGNQGMRGQS